MRATRPALRSAPTARGLKDGLVVIIAACLLTIAALPAQATGTQANQPQSDNAQADKASENSKPEMTMDDFLDRLMIAESGGRDTAKNPLSSATGAFQFIESTFLSVMQRHYPKRVENLSTAQILALRTDRKTARDAARAYTRDNAQILAANGHKPTFPHLRLAFLLGANGAMRILDAKPETPLAPLLGPAVMRANPFMTRLTASGLIARAARDVSLDPSAIAGLQPIRDPKTGKIIMPRRTASRPRIRVRCNLGLPSCRRWLALKRSRLDRSARRIANSKN
jgi:hypothetical protein